MRYNRLLSIMEDDLIKLKKAINGFEVMSEELEKISTALYDNIVPKTWGDKGFLSLMPLSSWIKDLNARV